MSQTVCVYSGSECPQSWTVKVIERHLSLGKIVNYYDCQKSSDIEAVLESKLSSKLRKIRFESDTEAVTAFKEQKPPKVAVGVTKAQSLDLGCPSVLVDIPTCLVLEGADVSSFSVLAAQKLADDLKKNRSGSFAALNVVILECIERDFFKLLQHHGTGEKIKIIEMDCFGKFDEEVLKLEKGSAVIVRHCNTRTLTFVKDQSKVPIINVHPVRTIQEGIGYVNKFPYKSNLFLWTDSVSILFSSWKRLDFHNIYANSLKPVNENIVYLNGTYGCFMRSALLATNNMLNFEKPIKGAAKVYEITLKDKSLSFKDNHEQILKNFPSWKIRLPSNMLCWAETDTTFQLITELKPKEKLSIGAYLSDSREVLATFLYAMSISGWAKLVIFAPAEFNFSKESNFQVSELKFSADICKFDVVFAPNGPLIEVIQNVVDQKQFEECSETRNYGSLTGPELAKHILVECSVLKQIQIPFSFITT